MFFKDRFRDDVDKYGYVFLGIGVTNKLNDINALSAFSDPEAAFACYGPLQKAKEYFDVFVFYLPFEAAKKAAASGNVRSLNINPGDHSTLFFCQNPKNEDFIGLLKNWFKCVENGIKIEGTSSGQKGDKC